MSTITKERVAGIASGEKCYTHDDVVELARIALASLEAEADYIRYDCGCCGWETLTDWRENDVCPKCNHHPMGKTELFTAPPAPVSVPDFGALTKCIVQRLVDYGAADDDAIASAEEFVYNACRAAMLQGVNGTLTNEGTIPSSTPCKDAPEHIWLQTAGVWPENGEFSELTWCSDNQHPDDTLYVRADVVAGNSPVIPDCSCRTCRPVTFTDSRFVVCPECGNKRCPHANDHRNACTGSNEPGQEGSAYPAAPQQEAKNV